MTSVDNRMQLAPYNRRSTPMRRFRVLALALLSSHVILAGCDKSAKDEGDVRPVRSVVVEPGMGSDSTTVTGEIRARYETDLGFRVEGKIVERPVDVGTDVKAGDVLARLDRQPWEQNLESAKADVTAAEANLVQLKAAEGRQATLLKDGYTTRANYDAALAALKNAESQADSAHARLSRARDNLGYTDLKADTDGVITAVNANVGQVVSAGQAVVHLAQPSAREAVFNVSEADLNEAPKDPSAVEVPVVLLADPKIEVVGHVRFISPQADPATRTYEVRVAVPNAPPQMRLGAAVSGSARLNKPGIVVLPGSALFQKDGKPAVWVVDPNTLTVSLKPVSVSSYSPNQIMLSGGLDKGDIVVTAGVQKLIPGQKVRLLESKSG